ncbi:hypothetical protein MTO96_021341 [Rhipicephalus appendiculatus]
MAYQVPPLDDGKDKWTSHVIRIESYFEGNKIAEDAQKRALLVSVLGSRLGPGDAFWAQNFADVEKGLPGTIEQLNGARIMTTETSAALLERHMDQVRLSDSSAAATSESVIS